MGKIGNDVVTGSTGDAGKTWRATLRELGRFAVVTGPSVVLLLAAGSKPSQALMGPSGVSTGPPISSRQFKISGGVPEFFVARNFIASGEADYTIDAIGLCLLAIKDLGQRIGDLESQLTIG